MSNKYKRSASKIKNNNESGGISPTTQTALKLLPLVDDVALNARNFFTKKAEDLKTELKHDALINGAFGVLSYDKNIGALRSIGGGIAGGIASGIPGTIVNHYADKASDKIVDHYLKRDDSFHIGHAAIAALPMAAAGVYTTGAMFQGMDEGKHLFNKNLSKEERLQKLKNIINPIEHVKRGIKETALGFKALNPATKMKLSKRLLGSFGILGLATAAIPVLKYHIGLKVKKQLNQQQLQNNNQPLYMHPAARTAVHQAAVHAANHGKNLVKTSAYIPVLTPFARYAKAQLKLRAYKPETEPLMKYDKEIKSLEKQRDTGIKHMVRDTAGLGLVGYAGYRTYKWAKNRMENSHNILTDRRFDALY